MWMRSSRMRTVVVMNRGHCDRVPHRIEVVQERHGILLQIILVWALRHLGQSVSQLVLLVTIPEHTRNWHIHKSRSKSSEASVPNSRRVWRRRNVSNVRKSFEMNSMNNSVDLEAFLCIGGEQFQHINRSYIQTGSTWKLLIQKKGEEKREKQPGANWREEEKRNREESTSKTNAVFSKLINCLLAISNFQLIFRNFWYFLSTRLLSSRSTWFRRSSRTAFFRLNPFYVHFLATILP